MITAIPIVIITFILIYHLLTRKPANFPPGPRPFPIFGTLLAAGVERHIGFQRMSKKYGPIVGLKFGPDLGSGVSRIKATLHCLLPCNQMCSHLNWCHPNWKTVHTTDFDNSVFVPSFHRAKFKIYTNLDACTNLDSSGGIEIGACTNIGVCTASKLLAQKFGPALPIMMPIVNGICIHGTELIKEALNEPTFSGRPRSEARDFLFGDVNGIIQNVGTGWSEQRRFALRHLRDFGFGKSSMEELIMDEVNEFISWLKLKQSKPVSLQGRFALAVVNSLWRIVSGERFDHDDAKLEEILNGMNKSANVVLSFNSLKNLFILYYPTIGKMFPNWSGWNKLVQSRIPHDEMLNKIIRQHKETFREDSARDFVDVYLQEIRKTSNPASSFNSKSGEESLKSVLADFFAAGTDTTSVTLSWLNLYLLHNPRVQKKLHEELDRVVGRSRAVTLSDRKSLVYTEAVILETMRVSSIAPVPVPHAATEDVKFHGYNIPKGTVIYANLHANHHNPEIWGEDVEEFRPERFLSPDETMVIRHEALIPFSIGRRVCLGETLARDTLFLFTANLALNFEVTVEVGREMPTLELEQGLTLRPVNSTVVMKERES